MSRNVMELLIAWNGARVGKRRKCAWAMIPLSLMWTIWRERNWTCFEGIEKPLFRIKRFVVSSLYSWDKGDCNPAIDQFLDWLELFFVK
ncbi:hypothetical protein RHMOL_Rhmol10G0132200 [Rhododendron molle]|nr:hypothetical protein RHMOL_Rhmol10G0132200 [Rhododendron molle]